MLLHIAPGWSLGNAAPFPWKKQCLFQWLCSFNLLSANVYFSVCKNLVRKRKPFQKLMQICVCQKICSRSISRLPWRLCRSLEQIFSSRVNLPRAVSPGLHLLQEIGLDHPHFERRSWQYSVLPSALWQTSTWNLSDLLTCLWHPRKYICLCRSLQRLKGTAERLCRCSLSLPCIFRALYKWIDDWHKFMSLISSLYPEH